MTKDQGQFCVHQGGNDFSPIRKLHCFHPRTNHIWYKKMSGIEHCVCWHGNIPRSTVTWTDQIHWITCYHVTVLCLPGPYDCGYLTWFTSLWSVSPPPQSKGRCYGDSISLLDTKAFRCGLNDEVQVCCGREVVSEDGLEFFTRMWLHVGKLCRHQPPAPNIAPGPSSVKSDLMTTFPHHKTCSIQPPWII